MRHPLDPDHSDPIIAQIEREGLSQLYWSRWAWLRAFWTLL
jgi:hypothetical protein